MASFDVKVKGISGVKRNVQEFFNSVKRDKRTQQMIGEKIVQMTVSTNQSGKSPNAAGGNPQAHQPLSDGWIAHKFHLSEVNTVSPLYRPKKSNLTFTGQLMDSIKYKVNGDRVTISAEGQHDTYIGLDGKPEGEAKSNDEIVSDLKRMGRYVFGITRQMQLAVNRIVKSEIKKKLKLYFNLSNRLQK